MIDRQAAIDKTISDLKDVAFALKTQQIVAEIESKHLKLAVDDLKSLLLKEIDKREKKEQEAKTNQTTIKVAMLTGSLGFITAIAVAIINFFKA